MAELVAQLQEELALHRGHFERVPAKSRPHFTPPDRLRVLVKGAEFLARGGLHLQSFDGAEDVARAAEGHAACGRWGRR